MKSLRYLYRIGKGPSSSHTIAPQRVAEYLLNKYQNIIKVDVTFYASLALTGKGHLSDVAVKDVFEGIETNVKFDIETEVDWPLTMDFMLTLSSGEAIRKRAKSLGGGAISIEGEDTAVENEVYPESSYVEIAKFCAEHNYDLADYVKHYEGEEIFEYLALVWKQMKETIQKGLQTTGTLPGRLHVKRRASSFLVSSTENESSLSKANRLIAAYAFATNEENAAGGTVVTAPTCGAAGTLPAVLMHMVNNYDCSDEKIVKALAVAGVIGNLIKQNGSISGAEAGCQAEVGTACSMAAAAASYLKGFSLDQIECAAESAMEHSLGLTCDPVQGYVMIPCIERNAVAAAKALTATSFAEYACSTRRADFDTIVKTMLRTGQDMNKKYRETAEGGLAESYKNETSLKKED